MVYYLARPRLTMDHQVGHEDLYLILKTFDLLTVDTDYSGGILQ